MNSLTEDEIGAKRVCSNCVGDEFLKTKIQAEHTDSICSYCDYDGSTISAEDLAALVDTAFKSHYERTDTEPDGWESAMLSDRESDYEWGRHGEQAIWAIASEARVDEELAGDIRELLGEAHSDQEMHEMMEECEFAEDSHYQPKVLGDGDFSYLWTNFERQLKTEARFFAPNSNDILTRIFEGLGDLRTHDDKNVVVPAGPSCAISFLFRARVFANEIDKLEEAMKRPWLHLGSPPSKLAGAGRMNARGISIFYGALSPETSLTEVRPPVGSDVASARFDILRPLKLLDLKAVKSIDTTGSIFDPNTLPRMEKANFLSRLTYLMARPVMPHEETMEYLPTQAIAEFLANILKIDGIIYPSLQAGKGATNVALFHHASRVQEEEIPEGTELQAYTATEDNEGVHPDYRVWVRPPKKAEIQQNNSEHPLLYSFDPDDLSSFDKRSPTLRIDFESVQVHQINSVKFQYNDFHVSRHEG